MSNQWLAIDVATAPAQRGAGGQASLGAIRQRRILPSMIRVDGTGKFEIDYEECAEALGWDDFGNDDLEEIMSTHYGRMVVLDDRIIMFANPEDAAEYISFDLQALS
jgi:hypothetical protein